jgi:hypothetical protein
MQREYGYCPATLPATLILAEARHPLDLQRVDPIALGAGDLDDLDVEPLGANLGRPAPSRHASRLHKGAAEAGLHGRASLSIGEDPRVGWR